MVMQSGQTFNLDNLCTAAASDLSEQDRRFLDTYKLRARQSFPTLAPTLIQALNSNPQAKIGLAKTTCASLQAGRTMNDLDREFTRKTLNDAPTLKKLAQADWAIVSILAQEIYCPG